MYQRIIVPLDGSAASEVALSVALPLLQNDQAEIILTRMQGLGNELGYPMGFPVPTETIQAEHARCDTYLLALSGRLAPGCQNLRRVVLPHHEDVAGALADLAQREHAQLVVMTSHGWEGLGRTLRGSVAEELARSASCPVLIIGPHTEVMQAARHTGREHN